MTSSFATSTGGLAAGEGGGCERANQRVSLYSVIFIRNPKPETFSFLRDCSRSRQSFLSKRRVCEPRACSGRLNVYVCHPQPTPQSQVTLISLATVRRYVFLFLIACMPTFERVQDRRADFANRRTRIILGLIEVNVPDKEIKIPRWRRGGFL